MAASRVPTVVDADALWALSRDMSVLENAACPAVLTPHEGEFAYLGGLLSGDRVSAARRFAERWGCTIVLKGEERAVLNATKQTSISTLAVDPAGTADVKMDNTSSVNTLVIAGKGGSVGYGVLGRGDGDFEWIDIAGGGAP